jgi:exosortase A
MKLESVQPPDIGIPKQAARGSKARLYAAAVGIGVIVSLLGWYWDTVQSLIAIWTRSDTFAHGFLIVPISAWLVWNRREHLAAVDVRPNFLVLPLLPLVGFGWLLGHLAGAAIVQQYSLLLMIVLLVWTILGNQVVRALAFPLFFLAFAVPVGDFLLPPLMEHTADFTIFALRLTGIPVHREGLFFTVPSGNWSVVEACSGLRYLIASLTVGVLYAHLTYRSFMRRAVFIAAAVAVPIVANWLRAYMIVMIGHLSSMKYAVGFDHLIYGWLFFGLVMLILFWVGSLWRETAEPRSSAQTVVALAQRNDPPLRAIMAATIVATVLLAFWPLAAARLAGDDFGPPPLLLEAPPQAQGWQPIAEPLTDWTPRFLHPRAKLNQGYAKGAARVGLYIGYYRNQRPGAALISSVNTLVVSNDQRWGNTGETRNSMSFNNEKIPLIEAQLRGPSARLLVWRWYSVDGRYTVNPYWAKLLQAKSKLFGRGDDGAVVIVYTELDTDRQSAASRLQDFAEAMLPAINGSLDHAR